MPHTVQHITQTFSYLKQGTSLTFESLMSRINKKIEAYSDSFEEKREEFIDELNLFVQLEILTEDDKQKSLTKYDTSRCAALRNEASKRLKNALDDTSQREYIFYDNSTGKGIYQLVFSLECAMKYLDRQYCSKTGDRNRIIYRMRAEVSNINAQREYFRYYSRYVFKISLGICVIMAIAEVILGFILMDCDMAGNKTCRDKTIFSMKAAGYIAAGGCGLSVLRAGGAILFNGFKRACYSGGKCIGDFRISRYKDEISRIEKELEDQGNKKIELVEKVSKIFKKYLVTAP